MSSGIPTPPNEKNVVLPAMPESSIQSRGDLMSAEDRSERYAALEHMGMHRQQILAACLRCPVV